MYAWSFFPVKEVQKAGVSHFCLLSSLREEMDTWVPRKKFLAPFFTGGFSRNKSIIHFSCFFFLWGHAIPRKKNQNGEKLENDAMLVPPNFSKPFVCFF